MKYKVGDIVTIKGKSYKILACNTNDCEDCVFRQNVKMCLNIGWCFSDTESSDDNIKFVEVSED